jgi:hypothetical protein
VLEATADAHVAAAGQRLLELNARMTMDWRGEYVKALLTVQAGKDANIEGSATAMAAPASMLFSKQIASSFKVTKAAVDAAQKTLGRLGAAHFPADTVPTLANDEVKAGLQQWVAVTILNALEELLGLLASARYAEWVVQQLTGQPAAVRRALKRKQATWRQVKAVHEQLLEWVRWAVQLRQREVVQQWPKEFQQQLDDLLRTPLGEVGGTPGGAGIVSGGSAVDKAALEVFLLQCELRSYNNEVDLVIEERQHLVEVLQQREHALRCALDLPPSDDQQQQQQQTGERENVHAGVAMADASDISGASGSSYGHLLGRRLLFLLELHSTEQTLQVARTVATSNMTPAQEMEQLAVAVEVMADDE